MSLNDLLNDLALRARQTGCADDLFADVHGLLWSQARRWQSRLWEDGDIYQLAAIGVLNALRKWDPDRGDFLPCLLLWMRSSIGNFVRRQGPVSCVHSHGDLDEDDPILQAGVDVLEQPITTPDPTGSWERRVMLAEGLEMLRPRDRQIVSMYLDGKLKTDIAKELAITKSAVSQRFSVIFDRLRLYVA